MKELEFQPTDINRVTKAFFTGENGRKTGESTGMGLYLAHEICHRLDHKMTIASTVGEGTIVSIYFEQEEHKRTEVSLDVDIRNLMK